DPLLLEKPLDRARLAELPVVPGERGAHLAGGAVPVVRGRLDHHRHAARRIPLVDDALELRAVAAAAAALDRALDAVLGHVDAASAVHGQPEPEISLGIGAAFLGGDHDLAG